MNKEYGVSIFCDDIRDEVNNKRTLVGVYASEMIIYGDFPAIIPTFGVLVTLREPLTGPVEPLNIKLLVPGASDEDEVLIDVDIQEDRFQQGREVQNDPTAKFLTSTMAFRLSPVLIQREGHIRVRAYKGLREIRLGSLYVSRAT